MASTETRTPPRISSTELVERLKNPQWKQETVKQREDIFQSGEAILHATIFSANHEDESLNISGDALVSLNQEVIMERAVTLNLDNYVAMNSFNKNRVLYRGWWNPSTRSIFWLLRFGPGAVGPPGGAHGGAIAAVLDQFAGYCAWPQGWCVTGELKVKYKSMIPLEEVVFVESKLVSEEGRKQHVKLLVHSLPVLVPSGDSKALETAEKSGATIHKFKEPVKGCSHYYVPAAKTIGDALMIKVASYQSGRRQDELPPGYTVAWTFGLELPKAKL